MYLLIETENNAVFANKLKIKKQIVYDFGN